MIPARARLYLVSGVRLKVGPLADLVGELAGAGVDIVQLREKEMDAAAIVRAAEPIARACRAANVPFIVNDRVDIARAVGADGVHLGQDDLPVTAGRAILPGGLFGGSTHSEEQIQAALREPWDYIAVGPVHETPTKPGRAAVGLELVRYAAARVAIPWFAIGGIGPDNLDAVLDAGARRIVVVRAVTESGDPPAAAAALRTALDQRPPEAPPGR